MYRLMDDETDPVLFDKYIFEIIEGSIPDDWESMYGDSGQRYCWPMSIGLHGWGESHEGVSRAVKAVKKYLDALGPTSWETEHKAAF